MRQKSTPALFAAAVGLMVAANHAQAQTQAPQQQQQPQQTAPSVSERPAEPRDRRWGSGGPGMMMGPGMMWGGRRDICSPRNANLAERRLERMERALRPTDAQRAKLDELKAASAKSSEAIASFCARDFPESAPARLELMEKRLEAMLQAVKTVRPAFDSFYASLDEEQKARLNQAGSRRGGWRHWHWRG